MKKLITIALSLIAFAAVGLAQYIPSIAPPVTGTGDNVSLFTFTNGWSFTNMNPTAGNYLQFTNVIVPVKRFSDICVTLNYSNSHNTVASKANTVFALPVYRSIDGVNFDLSPCSTVTFNWVSATNVGTNELYIVSTNTTSGWSNKAPGYMSATIYYSNIAPARAIQFRFLTNNLGPTNSTFHLRKVITGWFY